ncbi:stage III sporulation protein AD [Alkalibaculum bacchi]|uniref:Stage III sporulation protein AD n=1 Tax=Alkalibaculum bacchi TaxID=645887 RepID=A0A366I7U4_9FIRM|nr:stage III sporulation protein AD [Alkalibaculum bacchi]RBP65276.1 stage III sporulation protein AD [Alkalibaculum bacchi]
MDIFQIAIIGIVATLLIVLIKKYNPEYQIFIAVATGVIILFVIYSYLGPILQSFHSLWSKTDIDNSYFEIILKVIVIAYITEFGAQICKDAGENSIGMKIELAGKVIIVYLSVPIVLSLIDFIINLIP